MLLKELLKEARLQMGLSQVQFAEKLHLSFSTVNRWENGRAVPSRIAAVALITLMEENKAPDELIWELRSILKV